MLKYPYYHLLSLNLAVPTTIQAIFTNLSPYPRPKSCVMIVYAPCFPYLRGTVFPRRWKLGVQTTRLYDAVDTIACGQYLW